MIFDYVVLAVKPSDVYGKEASVIASFVGSVESEISVRALNEMTQSDWFRGDKNVKYCACAKEQLVNWCASCGVHLNAESAGEI